MEDLLFEVKNRIATITLNRPDSSNAFSMEMIQKWIEALTKVRDDDNIRVLVLTGSGKAFCAGGDLKALKDNIGFLNNKGYEDIDLVSLGINRKNVLWNYIQKIPLLMEEIDKPTIAAINGDAIGAGLDMTLQCDIRIASDRARFGEGYVKLGLVPGDGGGYLLPRVIGVSKALEMLWTGKIIDAAEAKEIGLVTNVLPHEQLLDGVYEFARMLESGPQLAIRLIKRTVQQGLKTDLRTSLDTVSSYMGLVTEHPDHHEGLKALLEKRRPHFE